ncbi:RNA methyltransferase [Echinicola sp. CAU 1574]|uniref:RNA methyltransferase n=1 Tax=Echinicola arenosa TaxID=2774144 RepID=A0ABR9APT7_9BACT|nr:RNA methyltransferase [Echinicola arenosa]MBD8490808.1 RNA methyltransferase [Echinicola arenosa]
MISKNTVKFIKSLQQKKFRKQENAFFVEGSKNVTELLLSDFEVTHLLYTDKYFEEQQKLIDTCKGECFQVTPKNLEAAGSFKTNDGALAVAKLKDNSPFDIEKGELAIALDDVRDPGNLGTIIRIADWYGIKKLIFSKETADFYNPKVLNSSMGSFTRVSFFYTELKDYLPQQQLPVYGAFLEGDNIHSKTITEGGIILMGNESKGISDVLAPLVTQKLTIPRFGHAESLNVAIATAVICDNFKRNS